MDDKTITLTNEQGEEVICDILFTYYSEEFKKNYAVIMPRGYEECTAYSFEEAENGVGSLHQIETEEEWDLLEELLDDYSKKLEEEESDCSSCSKAGSCSGSCNDEEE